MSLTLYGHDGRGSAAVDAALVLAGLPHQVVVAASWAPGASRAALQAVNPLAQIPTLVFDDGVIDFPARVLDRPSEAELARLQQANTVVEPVLDRHFPPAA